MKLVVIGVIALLLIVGGFVVSRTSPEEDISLPTPERPPVVVSPSITTTANKTSSSDVGNSAAPPAIREITLNATRFTFSPTAIRVKEGEKVKITVRNVDTIHGVFIPEFNARGKESLEFTATKKGNFPFYCATYCGSGHPDMQGTLIVE